MTAIVVWGERGTGKTTHGAALAKHYGKRFVFDEGTEECTSVVHTGVTVIGLTRKTALLLDKVLVLTTQKLPGAIHISDALREAGIAPFVHISGSICSHDFQGWREFADGRGGEQVCTKCGMGAMQHTLRTCW